MTAIAAVARRVVAVLERTPGGGGLTFAMAVPETCAYPIQEADLAEILGNLGENACRFARTRIAIDCEPDGAGMSIVVADDGPGIPEDERRNAVARGSRLDIATDGHGLGLAIVADIAAAYGGRLLLDDAGPGLRAVVELPARQDTRRSAGADRSA